MRVRSVLCTAGISLLALGATAAPASATTPSDPDRDQGLYCLEYNTQEEAQEAVDSGAVTDTTFLDQDGDGTICEEDDVDRTGVTCPPEEVSDIFLSRPGCDTVGEMEMPVGGVDTGAGSTGGTEHTGFLLAGGALAVAGAGGLLLTRRARRA